MARVLLGISGGVDSAVCARLLQEQGHTVEGAHLVMHGHAEVAAARTAAQGLGIPLHILDCTERFAKEVIAPFVCAYTEGRTPNPCTVCNRTVKLHALCDYARAHRFDLVATGHYARVGQQDGRFTLSRGADEAKDQSYMLWKLSQDELALLCLPLGERKKADLIALARAAGLPAADRKESQDICFLPHGDYAAFLEKNSDFLPPPGLFCARDGTVLGEHKGIHRYTVGQRRGLGISAERPLFVRSIHPKENIIVLAHDEALYDDTFEMEDISFLSLPPKTEGSLSCLCKVRYAAPPAPCTVTFTAEGGRVALKAPARALTPGQSAVFYDEEGRLLFGGEIRLSLPAPTPIQGKKVTPPKKGATL